MASRGWSRSKEFSCLIPTTINSPSSLRFTDSFAFGAPKVIGHFVTIWMITYADKVIVGNMRSKACISSLLSSSSIGHHTSILYINIFKEDEDKPTMISVAKYLWQHNFQRPNTHTFPISCPSCNVLLPWPRLNSVQRADGEGWILRCKTKKVVRGRDVPCDGKYTIADRPPSTLLEVPYSGSWYSCDADVDEVLVAAPSHLLRLPSPPHSL